MHGVVAALVIGFIALVVWIVRIPDRKKDKQRYNEFSKKFDEWNRR
jgi:L-serine deaminase